MAGRQGLAGSGAPRIDAERWARIQALFHEVADLSLEAQSVLLRSRAEEDPEVLVTVQAMLREDTAPTILDRDLASTVAQVLEETADPLDPLGRSFGPYRIERLLGEGGMGLVYLARRADLGSVAAIKILRDAWLSPSRQERFAAEQRTLARLTHDAIARLYDAGTLEDGTPWIAMEYVEGVPLTDWCEQRNASVEERLRLFLAVCDAVQHAHQLLIVHRDLKPSNILVTRDGAIKLLDFGIAKQLHSLDGNDQTRTALRLLTPAYAAPEQLRGDPVGVFTDGYALGVILYELLAGQLPYDLSRRTPGEIEATILEAAPARPSVSGRSTPHGREVSRPGWADLDVLCLTAMQKDPARRYQTVAALARDVGYYLAGQPLEARPDSAAYRLGKFLRRNRARVAAGFGVAAVVIGLVSFYTIRLRSARNVALAEAAKAQRIHRFTLNLFEGGDKDAGPADTLRVLTLVDRGLTDARGLTVEPAVQAEMYATLGSIYGKLGHLARADSILTTALEQRRRLFGDVSPEVIASKVALGLARADQARYGAADTVIREAVAAARRLPPPRGHPVLAEAVSAMGQVLQDQGRYEEAIRHNEEAVGLYGGLEGPPTAELAGAIARLAGTRFYAGQYDASDSLNRNVLERYRRLYGETHPLVGATLINLGASQQERGNYAEASRYDREGLAIIRGYRGEDHWETAWALTMLARSLVFQEHPAEADSLLRRALAVRERVYGPNHPAVASTVNELGNLAVSGDRLDDAERYFSRMIGIYRSAYPGKHYLTGIAEANLGTVFMRRQENVRAEQLFRSALETYAGTLESTHVNVGITRIKLGRVLLRQRRFAEAATESQAGYDILSKQANPAVSFLRAARTDLAAAYDSLRLPEKAAKFKAELMETAR